MESILEVTFTPAEFAAFDAAKLAGATCVVFDVLRATTSMMTALHNGATEVFPVKEISEALALRRDRPAALLAGEREGLRIRAEQTGGVDFDLGNSPREFTSEVVRGRSIIMTTTNGTRALQACQGASCILVGTFLNLGALAEWIGTNRPSKLLLVGAGTFEETAYEDILGAGALCELVWEQFNALDSAHIAREIYRQASGDLAAAVARHSRNARRLLSRPALRDDVAFCLRRDAISGNAQLKDGAVRVC